MKRKTLSISLMFPVKRLLFSMFLLISFEGFSQGSISMRDIIISYPLPEDAELRKRLNDLPGYRALSIQEKDVAYYLNYARRNPPVFLEKAINVFLINHPEVKSTYTSSLQKTFTCLSELPIIIPDVSISKVSRLHAKDLSTNNTLSHESTDGRTFQERMQPYVKGCGSESIHASSKFNALESILSLLFDFNVPDLGHRKSLLDPRFHKGGYGVSINAKGNAVLVIDFSCQ